MENQKHHMTIPAVIEKIEDACEFVNTQARAIGLGEDAVYHCHLSVEEVLTNVIEHGYNYDGSNKVVEIVTEKTQEFFIITIIDDAPQFDPLQQPSPDPSTPLWEREGGGWGIVFVKKYMDNLAYNYEGDRNHFVMEKQLTTSD
ncbi:MAG: ATP-binding protein [Aggregatilineales bacterium]